MGDVDTGVGSLGGAGSMNLVGRPAIPFALPDSEGRIHRLEEYRGHWLLLVFHRHLG